ncbi:LOW QUALITY PROTEIN: hypothetical protein MARPO_0082s0071 [Marchantia polymorpha]|uniref:Uncharacterized protein n=1 Tax=Marchantia polymorpha TaxID=3197 RepID=A0A2R6WK44_MARPO|nr:LOW QUALITY PROTEIN: hypothetical protein MARPO_0082s0071 [Marchantia polymorpha]|eukprot:PTQ34240.1 LOW QUALITY PROTEIN: hypothetical protein MARPO_0082s0071 [Marchantia polymorpha]
MGLSPSGRTNAADDVRLNATTIVPDLTSSNSHTIERKTIILAKTRFFLTTLCRYDRCMCKANKKSQLNAVMFALTCFLITSMKAQLIQLLRNKATKLQISLLLLAFQQLNWVPLDYDPREHRMRRDQDSSFGCVFYSGFRPHYEAPSNFQNIHYDTHPAGQLTETETLTKARDQHLNGRCSKAISSFNYD